MKKARDIFVLIGVIICLYLLSVLLLISFNLFRFAITQEPIKKSQIVYSVLATFPYLFLFIMLIFYQKIFKKSKVNQITIYHKAPELLEQLVRSCLPNTRSEKVRVNLLKYRDSAQFPRPMVMPQLYGVQVSLSDRVLENWSREAIVWSIKTDFEASKNFMRYSIPTFVIGVNGVLGVGFWAERPDSPKYIGLMGIFLFVIIFVLWLFSGFYFQLLADRKHALTIEDRCAAKEALSYPYFAQLDRSISKKWLFFGKELSGRARRLGIELEREYRASDRSIIDAKMNET